jgi:hypothetical protein
MGIFFGHQVILLVRENYYNGAWRAKFVCANEFFKRAYEIFSSRPYKRIFDASKETICHQFMRCQPTITRPKLPE